MRSCGGEEGGRPFLFRGLCPGSWDSNAKPSAHPSSSATQRLAEGKASDGDLPCPLGWPELAWSLLRVGVGQEGVSGSPRIPVSGAGVAAR